MSQNKLSDYVVGRVLTLLQPIDMVKYRKSRPASGTPSEFIVVNAFSIAPGRMQKFVLNVNYHKKNLSGGVPDDLKLQSNSQLILDILEEYESADMLIDFETDEINQESNDEHYANLRFSIKLINNT